jgi:hypothetical protein
MAKKSNRAKTKSQNRPAPRPAVVESQPEQAAPPPAEPRPARTPKMSRSQAAAERIEDEYAYIVKDLRRVFILAAAMFLLLIALNVAIRFLG